MGRLRPTVLLALVLGSVSAIRVNSRRIRGEARKHYRRTADLAGTFADNASFVEESISAPWFKLPQWVRRKEPANPKTSSTLAPTGGRPIPNIGKGICKSLTRVVGGAFGKSPVKPTKLGSYAAALYSGMSTLLKSIKARDSSYVKVPTKQMAAEMQQLGPVSIPSIDIDEATKLTRFSNKLMHTYMSGDLWYIDCTHYLAQSIPFNDYLDDPKKNTWAEVMKDDKWSSGRKKDWLLGQWANIKDADGNALWPKEMINFSTHFWRKETWDDGLEKAIAFNLIGAHRLEAVEVPFMGETLRFAVKLNNYAALPVRPLFGKYGTNLYFTASGAPAMIETPDGKKVARGDKEWQYWKFAWRTTLITMVTMEDHLHCSHLQAANFLSTGAREKLSPNHPLRRLLSVFSYNSVEVNFFSLPTLVGEKHALHRGTGLSDFNAATNTVVHSLPDLRQRFEIFRNKTMWDAMPRLMRQAPYYRDGQLLFRAIDRLVQRYMELFGGMLCSGKGITGSVKDAETKHLVAHLNKRSGHTLGKVNYQCWELRQRLSAYFWAVTGYHRHVGQVADYTSDPDLCGFSYKSHEAYVRPAQAMIMSVVTTFTATNQPKINQDYTHVFKGIIKENDAVDLMRKFNEELGRVAVQVDARNKKRELPNRNAHPSNVECSVAV